jgi:hypothetical protein
VNEEQVPLGSQMLIVSNQESLKSRVMMSRDLIPRNLKNNYVQEDNLKNSHTEVASQNGKKQTRRDRSQRIVERFEGNRKTGLSDDQDSNQDLTERENYDNRAKLVSIEPIRAANRNLNNHITR